MSTIEQKIIELLTPTVEALGFELYGVEYVRARNAVLRVYLDKEGGVTIDDCSDASYQISAVLDVEDPIQSAYYLEVSSPGLDRLLFTPSHYEQYIGEQVQVSLRMAVSNRRNFKGVIDSVDGEMINLKVDGQILTIALSNIQKGNIIYQF
ncbi:ribosome maturation factor RimP [Thorsellia kenyensis]|uniref:Ribosome maturation factor RimP n=1 Tax=Thorsellia kenyensis TaxID=1549888 RepID=A0ABV6CCV1_9GAMM